MDPESLAPDTMRRSSCAFGGSGFDRDRIRRELKILIIYFPIFVVVVVVVFFLLGHSPPPKQGPWRSP